MKDKYIVGQMTKELVEGTAQALKGILGPVELPPEISDKQIKEAILNITPEGFEQMMVRLEQKGVPRQEVITFLDTFSAGRRW